jgi:hypothetical protein
MTAPTPPDDLQFSTAEPTAPLTPDSDASAVTCAQCARPIATHYYTVAGRTMCGACKAGVERALAGEGGSRAGRITRSLLLGLGAAVLGAVIWFTVSVISDGYSFAIIAILMGWMVGRAVQMGNGGRGGRRYQVAAALLTYLSIAMSYGAVGIRELVQEKDASAATASAPGAKSGTNVVATPDLGPNAEAVAMDGSIVPASGTTADSAATRDSTGVAPSGGAFATAVALMLGFMFVLPIIANLSSMPSGLLGLAIMAFGIHQAWKMNAAVQVPITGPHRIGGAPGSPAPGATA